MFELCPGNCPDFYWEVFKTSLNKLSESSSEFPGIYPSFHLKVVPTFLLEDIQTFLRKLSQLPGGRLSVLSSGSYLKIPLEVIRDSELPFGSCRNFSLEIVRISPKSCLNFHLVAVRAFLLKLFEFPLNVV